MSSSPGSLVTVIIPSFNTGRTIERAINSVIDTGYSSLELLVVDDGSTDNSMKIIRSYADRYDWIQLLTHKNHRNRGIAATRNLALAQAHGVYVAFLDADDAFLPNRFDSAISLLDEDESVNVVYEPYELVHVSGKRSESMRMADAPVLPVFDEEDELFSHVLVYGGFPHTSSVTIRTEAIRKAGAFPPLKYCLEKPLWLKLYSMGGIKPGGNRPVSRYFLHETSTCAVNEAKAAFRFEDVRALFDVFKWMKKTNAPRAMTDLVESRMMGKYIHYTSYSRALENDILRDILAAPFYLLSARPSALLEPRFWRATIMMFLGKSIVDDLNP